MMDSILQDFRFELRALIKSPRFTSIALITLVLGIAANVAIFTFVDAALIRPLPYRDASRLVEIFDARAMDVSTQFESSYPDFLDWRTQQQAFDGLSGYSQNQVLWRGGKAPELLSSAVVTDDFFQTLGVQPVAGRDFRSGEDQAAAPRYALLSYSWWQRQFGGKDDVIGKTLNIDTQPTTIIGVLPSDFHFAPVGDPDIWLTLHATGGLLQRRNLHWLSVVARLKPGISRENAASAMTVIAERLEKQYPQTNDKLRNAVVPLNEVIIGNIRPILLMLLGAVALLLLIACANVANLLLARSMGRRNEMAIRTALGASKMRIIGLMLTEGLTLSITGAVLGLVVAHWTIKGFVAMIPATRLSTMPYLKHMRIDASVLFFAFALAVITGVVFALAPALQAIGTNVQGALKEGSRSSHSGSWRRIASALVIGEVALAMVLLAGSGLMVKSLYRLLNVNPGFDQSNLLGLGVGFSQARYPKDPDQVQALQNLLDRIRTIPGVKSVGSSSILPVSNGGNTSNLRVVGVPSAAPQGREANSREVNRTYFQTLGAELLQGSWFTEADKLTGPQRVIINKTLADQFMPGLDPLKQQIWFTYSDKEKPRQVIGVVRDVKEGPLDAPARPAIYTPMESDPGLFFNLIIRTEQRPDALVTEVNNAVRQIDPDAITFNVQTMDDRIRRSPAAFIHRYPATLAGVFAGLALLLGTIGLYGLVAYSVSQRTQEIGIRMALGAQRSNVLQMVLSQGVRLIVPGVAIGIAAALLVAYLMRSMLFGVQTWDPMIFVSVTVLLAVVTLLASYIPARTATKVDPMVALRYE